MVWPHFLRYRNIRSDKPLIWNRFLVPKRYVNLIGNKCGDDKIGCIFSLKLAPMGSSPGQAFADKDLLQHIDLARVRCRGPSVLFGKVIPP
jgi:hypothetical protein